MIILNQVFLTYLLFLPMVLSLFSSNPNYCLPNLDIPYQVTSLFVFSLVVSYHLTLSLLVAILNYCLPNLGIPYQVTSLFIFSLVVSYHLTSSLKPPYKPINWSILLQAFQISFRTYILEMRPVHFIYSFLELILPFLSKSLITNIPLLVIFLLDYVTSNAEASCSLSSWHD